MVSLPSSKCKQKGRILKKSAFNQLDNFDYPIISDPNRRIANLYGMLDPDEIDSKGLPLTCRSMFIIGPDKYVLKIIIILISVI